MPNTPRPTPAQTRALFSAIGRPDGLGVIHSDTHPRTVAVLLRHGWVTPVPGTSDHALTDEGRTAIGEPTTVAVAAAAERGEANRAAHAAGCRSWIDGDPYCDCTDEDEAPRSAYYRDPDLRTPVPAPVVHDHRPAAEVAEEAGLPVEAIGPCVACPPPADDTLPVDDYSTPRTMVEYPGLDASGTSPRATRPGFGVVWAVVVLLAAVVSLVLNVEPGVATLVAHATVTRDGGAPSAPAAPVPAPSAPLASSVSAPRVPAGVPARCEEDQSCWDCTTMGNRVCGYGTIGGPAGSTARGVLDVWCPAGSAPVDLSGDAPLFPSADVGVLLRAVGCEYGAHKITLRVPAHPNGVIHASGIDCRSIHASVCVMTNSRTATPHADAREAARRATTRPALVAWENLTGDESPAELDAILRAATDEARAHVLPARIAPRVCDVVTGYRGTGTIVSALHTGDVLVDWRDGHQTWVRASAVRVIGHDS